ncbi:MAG: alanyl-tRNA editing protein [Hyphomicrobiaceae bacterium]
MTRVLFHEDAYLQSCPAAVERINDEGNIILNQTIFFATGGGQPGDSGTLTFDGRSCQIETTILDKDSSGIVHIPAKGAVLPSPGAKVTATLDWRRRYSFMRVHTALHLLCSIIPFPVTGGKIGASDGRLDFDISEAGAIEKDDITAKLNALIRADHQVAASSITAAELEANPGLIRTMSVKPPTRTGRVRLVAIGENGSIDLQPCGGTHVRSTSEIGSVQISKIEKKGRQNRRVRLVIN